jgi:hypothetical protein
MTTERCSNNERPVQLECVDGSAHEPDVRGNRAVYARPFVGKAVAREIDRDDAAPAGGELVDVVTPPVGARPCSVQEQQMPEARSALQHPRGAAVDAQRIRDHDSTLRAELVVSVRDNGGPFDLHSRAVFDQRRHLSSQTE